LTDAAKPTPYHLDGQLPRFWRLQRLARKANMRLTSDGKKLHLRDAAGNDQIVDDLDIAEQQIEDNEKAAGSESTVVDLSERDHGGDA
jgi:hypothetical protein